MNANKRQHCTSSKLENYENERIINFLDKENCLVLSAGIIQLHKSNTAASDKWTKFATGIICLLENFSQLKKKYSLCLLDLTPKVIWHEDIDHKFEYQQHTDHFHYLIIDDGFIGFNFSFDEEAKKFYKAVRKALNNLNKTESENQFGMSNSNIIKINVRSPPPIPKTLPVSSLQMKANNMPLQDSRNSSFNFDDDTKKAGKKVVNKIQIGNPTGFVHLGHIGLSQDNSFDIKAHDNNKNFMMILDVLKKMNIEPSRKSFEYTKKFMQSNGGFEKYYNLYKKQIAPKPPLDSMNQVDQPKSIDITKNAEIQSNEKKAMQQITGNTLQVPRTAPPKPPAPKPIPNNQLESTCIHSPNSESNLSFISPIPQAQSNNTSITKQFNSRLNQSPSYISSSEASSVPPPLPPFPDINQTTYLESTMSINSTINSNSTSIYNTSNDRVALLKAIENFKGGLKQVNKSSNDETKNEDTSKSVTDDESDTNNNTDGNDLMSHLFKALKTMRPFLEPGNFDDEDPERNSDWATT